ncbi:MAG: signal recognition particle-docking protein FtsY [Promethearchaeota archaeon]
MLETLRKGLHSFTERLSTYEITEENIIITLKDLQLLLIKNDVSVEVAEKITKDVAHLMFGKRLRRFSDKKKVLNVALKHTLIRLLTPAQSIHIPELLAKRKEKNLKEPLVILFLGINGTGKTTTIAKMAYKLKDQGYRSVLAASDTFRAGAQEQLKKHADKLKIKIITGERGSDAASIAYDAIRHATARHHHAVLIDTAGRMAINTDLMGEMQKIKRVADPDLIILVADALAGNDAVNQAREFNTRIGVDGIILTKMDADTKGGAAISMTYTTKGKPILYIGIGQKYKDLIPFNAENFVNLMFK